MSTTPSLRAQQTPFARYRKSLWLLASRDLKVRYTTSALGYFWSILDPLVMAGIYYFIFIGVLGRGGRFAEEPYIVFLVSGLLPWMWFNGTISESTRAFLKESKLIRSTKLPRTIWVARILVSKGIEYLASLPVLAICLIATGTAVNWQLIYFIPAIILQAALTLGVAFIVAPLVVFFRDLERAAKLVLRFGFYASPIIYGLTDLKHLGLDGVLAFNPLSGIFSLYRAGIFPEQLDWFAVGISVVLSAIILAIGLLVFKRTERAVLKQI